MYKKPWHAQAGLLLWVSRDHGLQQHLLSRIGVPPLCCVVHWDPVGFGLVFVKHWVAGRIHWVTLTPPGSGQLHSGEPVLLWGVNPAAGWTWAVSRLSWREIAFGWLNKFQQHFLFPAVLLCCSKDSLLPIHLHWILQQMLSQTYLGCCTQPTYFGAISRRLQAETFCQGWSRWRSCCC